MISTVDLNDRSYDIMIDEKDSLPEILEKKFRHSNFVLITNDTLKRLYAPLLYDWANALNFKTFILKDGEQFKTIDTWKSILDFLLNLKLDRNTVIMAFGGGVIGDVAGFAASTFLRGVNYIQIPTNLLAMVDSSVGGKTGVNHSMGKNLIGSFYQPKLVWIDTKFIDTLPKREFSGGYAEVFKYAFIGGKSMFDFIYDNHEKIQTRDRLSIQEAISRSIEIKARIVSMDEKESGIRALLNFGHTFGHALEHFYNFKGIIHGEGVNWGIRAAIELGKNIGTIPEEYLSSYQKMISKQILPALNSRPVISKLYESMLSDKKIRAGKIRFIVPTKPGCSIICDNVSKNEIIKTLDAVFK
ncbi:MAG: 3-dehydroquinate synthase [Chitinispirillia bacterium]|jgi:3-dehydroquinate synthase